MEDKPQFLAYVRSEGLMEFEGRGFYVNPCVVEGNSTKELVENYYMKTGMSKTYLKESKDGWYDWGMAIEFIPLYQSYDVRNVTQILDIEERSQRPFKEENKMKLFISQPMRGLTDEEI